MNFSVSTKRYVRYIASVLALLVLVCAVLTSCSDKVKPIKPTDEEGRVVGTCGGYDVLYEELRYVNMNYKRLYESNYGKDVWNDPEKCRELKETVLEKLTYNYAVMALCAEVGIKINDKDVQEAVDEYIEKTVAEIGSFKEYKASLKANYLTDHYVRFTSGVDIMENGLYYSYTADIGYIENDDEKLIDFFDNGGCVRTLHVYIKNDKGEDPEANRARAEEVRQLFLEGYTAGYLIGNYSEDFNMTTTTGYYFTYGEMEEYYEDAAFSTEIGGVSEVVDGGDGYYVIFRLEPETEQILLKFSEMKKYYQYSELNRFITEKQKELKVELNEYGNSIDFVNMK